MEFSRQEYCNGFPFPSPGDLPDLGIEPRFLALQADSLPSEPQASPINAIKHNQTLRPLAELDGKPVFGENKESGEESLWSQHFQGSLQRQRVAPLNTSLSQGDPISYVQDMGAKAKPFQLNARQL